MIAHGVWTLEEDTLTLHLPASDDIDEHQAAERALQRLAFEGRHGFERSGCGSRGGIAYEVTYRARRPPEGPGDRRPTDIVREQDQVRLRVVSDSTPPGTVLVTDDGRVLMDVVSIDWRLKVDQLATVTVVFEALPVEVTRPEGWSE